VFKNTNVLCYGTNTVLKYRDFMLKHVQYMDVVLKCFIWSKAEMFIHVAIQNLVLIHRAQENRWRTDISDQWYFQPL